MKKLLITALALGAFGAACTGDKEATEGTEDSSSKTEAPDAKTVAFKIDGMT